MQNFLCAFFLFTASYAQTDYLVTNKNDTLRGELKILSYGQIDRVQVTVNKKKTYHTALQIRSIFVKGVVYAPVAYENTIRMMKLVTPGYLSLYKFRLQNQTGYDGLMLKKMTGETIEIPNLFLRNSWLISCLIAWKFLRKSEPENFQSLISKPLLLNTMPVLKIKQRSTPLLAP